MAPKAAKQAKQAGATVLNSEEATELFDRLAQGGQTMNLRQLAVMCRSFSLDWTREELEAMFSSFETTRAGEFTLSDFQALLRGMKMLPEPKKR